MSALDAGAPYNSIVRSSWSHTYTPTQPQALRMVFYVNWAGAWPNSIHTKARDAPSRKQRRRDNAAQRLPKCESIAVAKLLLEAAVTRKRQLTIVSHASDELRRGSSCIWMPPLRIVDRYACHPAAGGGPRARSCRSEREVSRASRTFMHRYSVCSASTCPSRRSHLSLSEAPQEPRKGSCCRVHLVCSSSVRAAESSVGLVCIDGL